MRFPLASFEDRSGRTRGSAMRKVGCVTTHHAKVDGPRSRSQRASALKDGSVLEIDTTWAWPGFGGTACAARLSIATACGIPWSANQATRWGKGKTRTSSTLSTLTTSRFECWAPQLASATTANVQKANTADMVLRSRSLRRAKTA